MRSPKWTRSFAGNPWFAGALVGAVVIGIVDALFGEGWSLIPLLAIPPLVAALRSGPTRTAWLAAACTLLALVLGIPDGIFGEGEHIVTVIAIAAIGLTAAYVARLREQLEERDRRSKLIADAGAALQRSFDPEASLNELARLAVPLLADWCIVHVRQADGKLRQIVTVHRDAEKESLARELHERWPTDPNGPSGVPAVIRTGRPEIYEHIPDELLEQTAKSPEHLETLRTLGLRSSMMLPLTARGRTLGSIVFTLAESGRTFGPEERKLADTLAERAAVALDNTQLYARASAAEAELRQSRDQLGAILDGVADGVTAQDPTGKMVYANEEALKLLGFPSVAAIQAVPIRFVLSRFEVFDEQGRPFPPDQLPGRAVLRGEPAEDALVRMCRTDTGEERWNIIKATPIYDSSGDLALAINVYEDVTDHIERERQQRMLGRAGDLLAQSLTHERTLEAVAQLCVGEFADLCAIDLLDGRHIKRVALAMADGDAVEKVAEMRRRFPLDPDAPTGVPAVIRTGAAELYPDLEPEALALEAASPEHVDLIAELGLRSAMFVPMTARGRTFGAMTFVAGKRAGAFDETDLYLAEELAARCAIAVDNARLFRERTRIARTLQESLLPPLLPELPGVDIGARFHAAGAGYEVGGDFYDVFEMGGGSFGVSIGDVCGKGADAAAVTALARYTLRATAMREPSPAEVLRTLNEAMLAQRGDRRFCTVAYARFDPTASGMRVTVAAGGHPLPLALTAGAPARDVGLPGTLLGVVPDPDLDDVTIDLEPGDALVLFTDGVTEARAPKRVWGSSDLAGFVGQHEPLRATAIAERIERGALAAQADEPRDDVAIVVVKVVAAGAPLPEQAHHSGFEAV
jgi:serine phosphatase RsbU (regulator of sigma subunit)/PAS domain-containing protein